MASEQHDRHSAERLMAVVIVSADTEWAIVRQRFADADHITTPYGDAFITTLAGGGPVAFMLGGWGKISAAASTQYAISRWAPSLVINLGTCGGFVRHVDRGDIIVARRTVVYDLVDRMGDTIDVIAWYATDIDLAWNGDRGPVAVRTGILATGDADLDPSGVAELHDRYGAIAGDWESGAIAYVCARNAVRCLILRGVSDIVGDDEGEAYGGNLHIFVAGAQPVMHALLDMLPAWLTHAAIVEGDS